MSDQTEITEASFNPIRMVWRYKALVFLAMVGGCVLGAFYYAKATPIYQSTAQVLVEKISPDLQLQTNESRNTGHDDYMSTHQSIIRSVAVIESAIRKINEGVQKGEAPPLKSFNGRVDLTEDIRNNLKVMREFNGSEGTSCLNISFRASNNEDCKRVVVAIVESYQDFLSGSSKLKAEKTKDLVDELKDALENRFAKVSREYEEFTNKHPGLWRTKEGISLEQARVLSLEGKKLQLLMAETDVQGRMEAFEKAMKDGKHSQAELLAMISLTAGKNSDAGVYAAAALEEKADQAEQQLKNLSDDFGPEHPQMRHARGQVELLRNAVGRLGKAPIMEESGRLDPVQTHVRALRLELENTRMATQAVTRLLKQEQEQAMQLRGLEKRDENYRKELDQAEKSLETIRAKWEQLSVLRSDSTNQYSARLIAEPKIGQHVFPKVTFVFSVSLLLGLLAGAGLAYLAELSDQSFRTPDEIRRQLGVPVVGHIPFFEPREEDVPTDADAAHLDANLCTVYHPKSREAESYRGVRTAVFFSAQNSGAKLLQVTSPDMGDGKTTLACNLAVSIAQSGKKVLMIDADFRRPRLHKIFDLKAGQGIVTVLLGEAELNDVIQESAVPNLDILPCGATPPNPAELLTLPRFQELLNLLRDRYDFVVVDTPPLLAVTDPCVVVPMVDGVVMTVRISKNARPHALRAKEILTTLGANLLGVVVNGVGRDAKGYGYDGYRYGYSYRYYNYGAYTYSNYYYAQEDDGEGKENGVAVENGTPPTDGNGTAPKRRRRSHANGTSSSSSSSAKDKSFLSWLLKR